MEPKIETPPAEQPARNWFAKLDPAVRALIVLVLSTAISIGWQKLFPGVPVPQLPTATVVYVGPHEVPPAK
jgi:hypothetical protein